MKTIILAGAVSLLVALFGTPVLIRLLRKYGYGQPIRVEGLKSAEIKRGTPTMGGAVMVLAAIVGYIIGHVTTDDPLTASGVLVLVAMTGLGLVGFVDDFLKIFQQTSVGLRSGAKLAGQIIVGAVFAFEVLHYPNRYDLTPADAHLSFLRDFGPALGVLPFVIWIVILMAGASNAVNLTDGLDGLAIGCVLVSSTALTVLTYVSSNARMAEYLEIQKIPAAGELVIFCGSLVGASLGFLWYNAHPAEMFMGDVGSLALGGAIGVVAVIIKQEILLLSIGGVFVLEALSVIIQVGSFKLTGKRVFRMAPLHHHFELLGWSESKIIVRFWIVALVFALFSLTTLKLR